MTTSPQEPVPEDSPLERDLTDPDPPPQDPNQPPIDDTPAQDEDDILRDTRGRDSDLQ